MMIYQILLLSFLIMLISFIMNKYHLLMMLLILESMMMVLLFIMFYFIVMIVFNPYMFLLMLALSACEAALGLSVLINFMRFHGNDLLTSMMSMKWFAKNIFN